MSFETLNTSSRIGRHKYCILCIYISTFIYICIYMYIHIYIHIYIRSFTIHMYKCVYIYIYIHTYICTCIYTCIYIFIYVYIHTHMPCRQTYVKRNAKVNSGKLIVHASSRSLPTRRPFALLRCRQRALFD